MSTVLKEAMRTVHLVLEFNKTLKVRRTSFFPNLLSKAKIFDSNVGWETGGDSLVIVDCETPSAILWHHSCLTSSPSASTSPSTSNPTTTSATNPSPTSASPSRPTWYGALSNSNHNTLMMTMMNILLIHPGLPLPTSLLLPALPSLQSNSSNNGSATKPSSWPAVATLTDVASTCPANSLSHWFILENRTLVYLSLSVFVF